MDYDKYDWYFGDSVTCCDAVKLVTAKGIDGIFLVRKSRSSPHLVLSYSHSDSYCQSAFHEYIIQDGADVYLENDDKYFRSLPDLINWHSRYRSQLKAQLLAPPAKPQRAVQERAPQKSANQNVRANRPSAAVAPLKPQLECQLQESEVKVGQEIGKGSFGVVYKGVLRGKVYVAVKQMNGNYVTEESFLQEANHMMSLKHPHVVRLCGVCTARRPFMIVMEYMSHGSLLNYLKKHKTSLLASRPTMLRMCQQVCLGMAYLESQKFIHRDLAARNCLVGDQGVVKVCDFGISKLLANGASEYNSNENSIIPYTVPPEVHQYRRFSSKSDVWSFGLLMWEVFTGGEVPYGQMGPAQLKAYVEKGFVCKKPQAAKNIDYELMNKCWEVKPENRPTFAQISGWLSKMVA